MNNNTINEVLDLQPYEEPPRGAVVVPANTDPSDTTDEDFEYARGQMLTAIEKGQEALSGIVDVASMSQNPRSFEVVATLVNAVASASKDLMELSKRKKELKGETGKGPTTVNQNLYVGNTAELLRMLKGKGPDLPE